MIEQRYPLERFQEAMDAAHNHLSVKVSVDLLPR